MRANLESLHARIAHAAHAAHRTVDCITLVAVGKGHAAARLRELARLGVRDFGESYLQEALPKIEQLHDLPLVWHFTGRLQTNKTAPVAAHFDWVHGLERVKVAERLSLQRPKTLAPLNLCIQVNIDADPAKAGVAPEAALPLAQAAAGLPGLKLRGLMCIPAAGHDALASRRAFVRLRELQRRLIEAGIALDTLSMGMSGDFAEAIQEGATMVRIGTALFGERANPMAGGPVR